MARPPTGQVIERRGIRGTTFSLRFRAYGERRYVTLGSHDEGWTHECAEIELANVLADVRRGIWRPPQRAPVPTLLDAAKGYLRPRGRPLVATLAGAGLRIDECLSLRRRDVSIAKGTLSIGHAKTDAGVRVVDVTPALRDELAIYLDRSVAPAMDALVFPTKGGRKDTRQNVRRRLLVPAIEKANERLVELGLEPIGKVSPHGLRRTYASLRAAAGDDPAYTADQLGHEDPTFTLRVYTGAAKRLKRLAGAEAIEFDRALTWAQWARMGTNSADQPAGVTEVASPELRELA